MYRSSIGTILVVCRILPTAKSSFFQADFRLCRKLPCGKKRLLQFIGYRVTIGYLVSIKCGGYNV